MFDLEVVLNKLYSIIDRKKQNALTAGENITIVDDVISAKNIVYTAGEGLKENENEFIVTGFTTQPLTATTDFNSVIINGVYSCPAASDAETYNRPIAAIGILEVKEYNVLGENKLIVQIFHRGSSSYNESYIRRKYTTGNWGQWNALINQLGEGLTIDSIYNKAKINYTVVQKKLIAGDNINLDNQGNISAVNTIYSAGEGLVLNDNTFNVDYTKTQKILSATDGLSLSDDTISLASKSYTTSTFPWRDIQNERDVPSFNKVYQEGAYALSLYGAGNYSSVANTVGFPLVSDLTIYGELIVSRAYSTSRYIQIYIYTPSSTASYRTRIFFRSSYNNTGGWKDWREVASLDDIANLDISSLSLEVSATDYPWWVEP